MATKKGGASKGTSAKKGGTAKGGTKAGATGIINARSLTATVGKRSSLADINRAVAQALGKAGCSRCLSGLDRLILDSRINVG